MEYLHQAFAFSRGMQGRRICHCEGISSPGRGLQSAQSADENAQTDCVPIASVAALTVHSERHAVWQSLRHTFCGARLPSLSLRGPNGAVAISQNPAELRESDRRKRNCLSEIAPQGHFLALRAQGATSGKRELHQRSPPTTSCRKNQKSPSIRIFPVQFLLFGCFRRKNPL